MLHQNCQIQILENCISNFSPFAFTKQLFSEPVIFHQRNFPDRNASMFVLQILVHKLSQEPMCGDVFSDFYLSGIVLSKMWSQVSATQTERSINICTKLTNTWRGRTAGYSLNRKLDFYEKISTLNIVLDLVAILWSSGRWQVWQVSSCQSSHFSPEMMDLPGQTSGPGYNSIQKLKWKPNSQLSLEISLVNHGPREVSSL